MLELDGAKPELLAVADLTPEGHATPLFGVVADYGWATRTLFSDAYERDARAMIGKLVGNVLGEADALPVTVVAEAVEAAEEAIETAAPA